MLLLFSLIFSLFAPFTFAQSGVQPDFSQGSSLLDATLQESTFRPLFFSNLYLKDTLVSRYRFIVNDSGLLCPQRIMKTGGRFEFFSNSVQNAGCLDLNLILETGHAYASFQSEKNPIRACLNGIPEEDGKSFMLDANLIASTPDSFVVNLNILGKTSVKKVVSAWVVHHSQFNVRFSRTASGWSIAYDQKAFGNASVTSWNPFTQVSTYVAAPSIKQGISFIFSSKGNRENPLSIRTENVEFR